MAREDNKPTAPAAVSSTTVEAPKPRGFFDELKDAQAAQSRGLTASTERHTFGAWARSKGVNLDSLKDALSEGRISKMPSYDGDGPLMTEIEFEAEVGFQLKSTFGTVPGQFRHHVTSPNAQRSSLGGPDDQQEPGPRRV